MQDVNSCTVLTTHFVIDSINYTYSKLVELWPLTLAPTNEDSGGYREEDHFGKKPLMLCVCFDLRLDGVICQYSELPQLWLVLPHDISVLYPWSLWRYFLLSS